MHPFLIDLGSIDLPWLGRVPLRLPTYGVLFAAGALVAGWWFLRRGRRLGVPDEHLYNLGFYSLLAGILGAKATLVALDLRTYIEHPAELLGTLRSAGVLLGGLIAGAVAFVTYARRHDLPMLRLGDAVAAPLALAQAIGRLGCFAAGCCWGIPVPPDHPLAVVFRDPSHLPPGKSLVAGVHPESILTGVPLGESLLAIQLVQMANDLVLAAVLSWLWRRRLDPPGTVFWIYLLLYGATRGLLEFWRGDKGRGLFLGGAVSTSQVLALAAIAVALAMLVWGRRQRRQPA